MLMITDRAPESMLQGRHARNVRSQSGFVTESFVEGANMG